MSVWEIVGLIFGVLWSVGTLAFLFLCLIDPTFERLHIPLVLALWPVLLLIVWISSWRGRERLHQARADALARLRAAPTAQILDNARTT